MKDASLRRIFHSFFFYHFSIRLLSVCDPSFSYPFSVFSSGQTCSFFRRCLTCWFVFFLLKLRNWIYFCFRCEGTTQWYTAVIVGHNPATGVRVPALYGFLRLNVHPNIQNIFVTAHLIYSKYYAIKTPTFICYRLNYIGASMSNFPPF